MWRSQRRPSGWHAAFLDHAVEELERREAFRPLNATSVSASFQHAAAVAVEQRREHPVVARPAEEHADVAVAERVDALGVLDD